MYSMSVPNQRDRNTFSIGLILAFTSWALIFVTLVWGYMVFRLRSSVWLAEYLTPQISMLAFANTAAIIMSSLALARGFKTALPRAMGWLWSSVAMGIVFLIGQVGLWHQLMGLGLDWHNSHAGSFFFLLTGFHALHIIGGLIALFVLCLRYGRWQGTMTAAGIKYFWDFLYIIWLCLFVLIFIIR